MTISLVSQERVDSCFWGRDGAGQNGGTTGVVHCCWSTHTVPVPLFSAKNVAADIAVQLCDSVANKLEGKVMGTFSSKYLAGPGSAGWALRTPAGRRVHLHSS